MPATDGRRKASTIQRWKSGGVVAAGPEPPESLGHPWIPDSVKELRRAFTVSTAGQVGAALCHGAGRLRDVAERQARGRPGAGAGMDGLSPAGRLPDLRRDGAVVQGKNAIGRCSRRAGMRRRWSGSSSRTIMAITPPALRAQLRIEHTDGSVEWVATDASWQANTSYILHSELYDGESQDLRGWSRQSSWDLATFVRLSEERDSSIPRRWRLWRRTFRPFGSKARLRRVVHRAQAWRFCLRLRAELFRRGKRGVAGPRGTKCGCGLRRF